MKTVKWIYLSAGLLLLSAFRLAAQLPDTTLLYGERRDTLQEAVFTSRSSANYISATKDLRTEVISAEGLMKMACCNLAESFENSASVTVGYADATTGARQIRLLGLSGTYTQMLDENRPALRGIVAPFSLSYMPGSWLESIQVGKGSPSVVNGTESITGSINLEHKKPTDSKPLFVNASIMTDTKTDLNVLSSLDLGKGFYTILMGHADGNFHRFDMNRDGFADDPWQLQFNLANRWLYYTPALQLRWGVKVVRDHRVGGQIAGPWISDVTNHVANGYFKAGRALREDNSSSVAFVADYSFQKMDSFFGNNAYDATQHSVFGNLIYRNQFAPSHDLTAGVNVTADFLGEVIRAGGQDIPRSLTGLWQVAPYAEYTFRHKDRFSLIAGFSATWFPGRGFYPVPRLTLKYQPASFVVFRANGGRGVRAVHPVADHIGILSTGKQILGDLTGRTLEDAWTYGGNVTFYIGEMATIGADFFRTRFVSQVLADRENATTISLYPLDGHLSYSNNWQVDFSIEPVERLSFTLTGRLTDAHAWQPSGEVRDIALSSKFKAVFNAQYKTRLSRWIFDLTASLVGPSRVYDFMLAQYPSGKTPLYPLLYAQVTRRFRLFDIYLGGENLTGFMQKNPIVDAENPFSNRFDAASVWGPLMGVKVYAGFRLTIWK